MGNTILQPTRRDIRYIRSSILTVNDVQTNFCHGLDLQCEATYTAYITYRNKCFQKLTNICNYRTCSANSIQRLHV